MPSSAATQMADDPSPLVAANVRAYGRAMRAVLTPLQASIQVHEILCRELVAAKAAYQAGRLDKMCRHTQTCMNSFMILHGGIKLKPGAKEQLILSGFYLNMFERTRTILHNDDVVGAFDTTIKLMMSFCGKMRSAEPRRPATLGK